MSVSLQTDDVTAVYHVRQKRTTSPKLRPNVAAWFDYLMRKQHKQLHGFVTEREALMMYFSQALRQVYKIITWQYTGNALRITVDGDIPKITATQLHKHKAHVYAVPVVQPATQSGWVATLKGHWVACSAMAYESVRCVSFRELLQGTELVISNEQGDEWSSTIL